MNTSHDTSALACGGLAAWWEQHGRTRYPEAKKALVLCNGRGSNNAPQYLLQEDLQE